MFPRIPPILRDLRSYARKDVPWVLDADREMIERTKGRGKYGWKLFHYLAGGGLKALGRTVEQEVADAKRNRFLYVAAALALAWLVAMVW